ncbi:glycosyltransferase family 4 protein [Xenorhabdus bovienii]|uniref:glycosyltransferase family 4 protein n=1 Tax=Xenorhabdus bovienii TaxID=40576 RepID=UPI003DA5453E
MNKKKIILCGNSSWSMYNFRLGLIKELIKRNYEVIILAPNDQFSQKLMEIGCRFLSIPLSGQGINPIKEINLLYNIISIYKNEKPDMVINYTIKPNIYGSFASKITKTSSIAITTGLGFTFTKNNIISSIAKLLYRLSLSFAKEVWFLNSDDQAIFIKEKIIKKEKTKILYSEGICMGHFHPIPYIKEENSFSFILIARMLRDKGILEFVSAAKIIKEKYPNTIFKLLGFCDVDNPSAISRKEIDDWVAEGLIEYLGDTDDVRPYIAASDCVVLPSFYREGIPRILMEASAMEKPIITTDNVGCREVIQDGITGFFCKIKDPISLAQACEKFLNLSYQQITQMGYEGRNFVSNKFSEERIIKEYFDSIEKYLF